MPVRGVSPVVPPALPALLEGAWGSCLGVPGLKLQYLSRGPHADSASVYVVRDARGSALAVVLCASPAAPAMVARSMQRTRDAHAALAGRGTSRVLLPLAVGEVDGLSCALVPYCQGLEGRRLQRWWDNRRLRAPMFDWLRDVAQATQRPAGRSTCEALLTAMAGRSAVGRPLRGAAERALERLGRGDWQPRHALMHGDLWRGNLMLRGAPGSWASRLVVIDWSGSRHDGWPFFDLVRLADSIGARSGCLRTEVERHAVLLGCHPLDAHSSVSAALAATLARLEHFPVGLFAAMGERALARLEDAIGSTAR
jgi:hypothetical protein